MTSNIHSVNESALSSADGQHKKGDPDPLHDELSDAAVVKSAEDLRIVWAQVKGYPFWPAQVLLAKDAKIKFRDTAQEYTDKRMATQRPVLFFVTKEISWVHNKQIKPWGQGMADGCHTKNRSSQKFRQALVQVGDLLLGRKSAPQGFTKPTSPAVRSMTPITAATPTKDRRSDCHSPEQVAAPSAPTSASKPKQRMTTAAEQYAEQQQRSKNAILGGISRDERHRRRTEGRTSDSAVQSQASPTDITPRPNTVSPFTPRSAKQQAQPAAQQQPVTPPSPARVAPARVPMMHSAPAASAPASTAGGAATAAEATENRRFSSDGVMKRHTRSQGTAELGLSDVQNLEPRKAPRRALSCVAPGASGMGSRGTGDGASGRLPTVDTPRSVGTHPPGPFAEDGPGVSAAPLLGSKILNPQPQLPPSSPVAEKNGRAAREEVVGGVRDHSNNGIALSPCDLQEPSPEQMAVADAQAAGAYRGAAVAPEDGAPAGGDMRRLQQGEQAGATSPRVPEDSVMKDVEADAEVQPESGVETRSTRGGVATGTCAATAGPPDGADISLSVAQPAEVAPQLPTAMEAVQPYIPPLVQPQVQKPIELAVNEPEQQEGAVQESHRDSLGNGQGQGATPPHSNSARDEGTALRSPASCVLDGGSFGGVEHQRKQSDVAVPANGMMVAQAAPRNGESALQPCPPEQQTVSEPEKEAQEEGGAAEQHEDGEAEGKAIGRRPRRAAVNRKSALELVHGDSSKGTARGEGRAARSTADAAARSQAAGRRSAAAGVSRKRSQSQTVSPDNSAPVARTRPRMTTSSAGQEAVHSGQDTPAAGLQPVATAASPAALGGDMIARSVEQVSLLQARSEQGALSSDEHRLLVQLQEYIRNSRQVQHAAAPAQQAAAPVASAAAAAAIGRMFQKPVPFRPSELWLPPEFCLMRHVPHQHIDVNRYPTALKPKKIKCQISVCNCSRDPKYSHKDTYCCGEGCLNRTSHILCDSRSCPCRGDCKNKPFNLRRHPKVEVVVTDSRGSGLVAREAISKGSFVVEYTGEVITEEERWSRTMGRRQRGAVHFYIMELSKGLYIDAEHQGSNARFMNSSCDPNCETQKWKDASTGETRIGLFTTRAVGENEELTYDYHFQHAGLQGAAQGFRCMCGSANCRGTMDVNPERSRDMGRRVRIKWDGDDKWYEGYVLRYNPSSGKHTIYYPPVEGISASETQETLSLSHVEHEWIDEPMPSTDPGEAGGTNDVLQKALAADHLGVLSEAAAAEAKPAINPATGRVAGDVAAEATRKRTAAADARMLEEGDACLPRGPITGGSRAATAPDVAALPPLCKLVKGPAAAGMDMIQLNRGERVRLPRPLPERPVGGLELLSQVAASLPDRAHTPALSGAATGPPMFAVLRRLKPHLPASVPLSEALPAAGYVVPTTNAAALQHPSAQPPSARATAARPAPRQDATAGFVPMQCTTSSAPATAAAVGLAEAATGPPGHVPPVQPQPPTPTQPLAHIQHHQQHQPNAVRAVSPAPDMRSHHSHVLAQAPHSSAQPQTSYAVQAMCMQALQQLSQPTEAQQVGRQVQQPDAAQLQQTFAQATSWPPDAQQRLAASMQALVQAAVQQPFPAGSSMQQQQQHQMLLQMAANITGQAGKQAENALAAAAAAAANRHTQAAASPSSPPRGGSTRGVPVDNGATPDTVQPKVQAAQVAQVSNVWANSSAAERLQMLRPTKQDVQAAVQQTRPYASAPGAVQQPAALVADAAKAIASEPGAASPARASLPNKAGLTAHVSAFDTLHDTVRAASTQASASGEEPSTALAAAMLPPLHPNNHALPTAGGHPDAQASAHGPAPHPMVFAQQMPNHQSTIRGQAVVQNAAPDAQQQQQARPAAGVAIGGGDGISRGHFANAALTAAHAGASAPSSATEQHWMVRLNVSEASVRAWVAHATQNLRIAEPLHESMRPQFLAFMNQLQLMQAQARQRMQALGALQQQDGPAAAQQIAVLGRNLQDQQQMLEAVLPQQAHQAFVQPTS